jgi:O-antigen/teichoic acid export membrane protein
MSEPAAAAPSPSSMREVLRRLTGESLVYGLGQVSGRAVQVLLVPVITLALTPAVFAIADLVQAYSALLVFVLVMGMDAALVRFFYNEPDRDARRTMVTTSLVFRVIVSTLTAAMVMLLVSPVAGQLLGSPTYVKYVLVGAVSIPFTMLVMFSNDVLRVTFQPWKFIVLNLVQTVVTGGLTLWWVMHERRGVIGMLYGKLAGDAITALLGLVLLRPSLLPRVDRAMLRRMLGFGLPLLPGAFAYGVVSSADRYFLQRTHGLETVGVYAVAIKFFTLMMMCVTAFSLAFFPIAHARAGSPDAPRLYARVLALYMAVASGVALAVSLFTPEVLSVLVQPAYRAAAGPAALLTFAAVAYGAYHVACLGIQFSLRTHLIGLTTVGGAVAAVIANALLAGPFGMMGSAGSTLIANGVLAVLTYVVAQSVHPLPYRGRRLLALFGLAVVLSLVAPHVAPPGPWSWAVRFAALAVYAVVAAGSNVWRERGAVTAAARVGS